MEEILASIRKIISEDQPGPIKPKGPDSRSGNGAGDILELTEEIPDEANGVPRSPAPGAPMPAPAAPQPDRRDPVLSDSSQQTIGRAFESLDAASQQYSAFAGGMLESVFSRSVQEAVTPTLQAWVSSHETQLVDSIKPLAREWMDANLPRLVESVLKQEVVEAAKPLMREWIDANLPQLVETVLKQELGRAVTEHLRSRLRRIRHARQDVSRRRSRKPAVPHVGRCGRIPAG
jgi:cell pole-organizing protein PopZ